LFIHLSGEVREQLLLRCEQLAQQHAYTEVRRSMQELLPVLLSIQQDVQAKLASAKPMPAAPPALDLSVPAPADSAQ
jgi:hypothetical protein